MNNLPSNQNTNEIDVPAAPERVTDHRLTLIEAPLIFQHELSDTTVRLRVLPLY